MDVQECVNVSVAEGRVRACVRACAHIHQVVEAPVPDPDTIIPDRHLVRLCVSTRAHVTMLRVRMLASRVARPCAS